MAAPAPFCFPIRDLSNDRVKLTPFLANRHADAFFRQSAPHPELFAQIPTGPYASKEEFITEIFDEMLTPNSREMIALAVIDKTRAPSPEDDEGELAGIMCYMSSSVFNRCTEIGFVVTLPAYQRSHVTTNAVGLMLKYALDPPQEGGLGLVRVEWYANAMNAASIRAAERMGFSHEAVLRWHKRLAGGRKKGKIGHGRPLPPGCDEDEVWRDSVILSLSWHDWVDGAREKVETNMNRVS